MVKQTEFQKGVLKLAKAMEQGISKTKKVKGMLFSTNDNGEVRTCALGAAAVNGFNAKRVEREYYTSLSKLNINLRFPVLQSVNSLFPVELELEIVDRNDVRQHSRERIVKWLRRLAKLETPPKNWSDVK